jgi:ABC-2 family transporter protein
VRPIFPFPILLPRGRTGLIITIVVNLIGVISFFTSHNAIFLIPGFIFIPLFALGRILTLTTARTAATYFLITFLLLLAGLCCVYFTPIEGRPPQANPPAWSYTTGVFLLSLAGCAVLFGFIEFVILRLVGLFTLGAISRITYYEALLQPFTLIVVSFGIAAIVIGAFVPFFTLSEDSKMYRDVAVSIGFLFTLPIMIFAATKVIDEEIENRTMLTLMSKPVARWQVVVGKYLGVLFLIFGVMIAFGIVGMACAYLRFYDDMRIDYFVANTVDSRAALNFTALKALLAMVPAILLQFLQVATLAAVSVAVSTRWGLALNITVTVILYIGANLARYAGNFSYVLPGLGLLDISQRLVYGDYNYGDNMFYIRGIPSYSDIWQYVGLATAYSALYISAALSFGIALFRNRELT